MSVLVTGGRGFLGFLLARELACSSDESGGRGDGGTGCAAGDAGNSRERDGGEGETPDRVIALDLNPPEPHHLIPGIRHVVGDLSDPVLLADLIRPQVKSIFHLAAVVSGQAERNYDLGFKVNFDCTRALLHACRLSNHCPRIVMASSVAVFGPPTVQLETNTLGHTHTDDNQDHISEYSEDSPALPRSSYGTQKAMCELMLSDASRRGYVDARVVRLPTVVVRPGSPNAATSSFCSSIIREPLIGQSAVCPVDPLLKLWLQSPRTAVRNILHAHGLEAERLKHSRIITLPGLTTTPRALVDQLKQFGADPNLVSWSPDPLINAIVSSWPGHIHTTTALALGFQADSDVASLVQQYVDDYLPSRGGKK